MLAVEFFGKRNTDQGEQLADAFLELGLIRNQTAIEFDLQVD